MSKVSIVKCEDYTPAAVFNAMSHAITLLGGIERFVRRDSSVLIKPNLLSARLPEEAVCTHPEVVRAAVRIVKEAGGRPQIGDSPGNFFTVRDVDAVYEKTGIKAVADQEGAQLVTFDKVRYVNGYPIAEAVFKASTVISLPKLKTHALTVMTGAVKNMFGVIPGLFKVECHRRKPKPEDFAEILLDIYQARPPQLSIMDGIVAMEGDGPAAGEPRRVGLLLASSDGVSLDAVVSTLVSLPAHADIVLNSARQKGIGEADVEKIEVLGETLEGAAINRFKLPKTARRIGLIPDVLLSFLSRIIRFAPVIDEELCRKCGVCKKSCPTDAITINEKSSLIDSSLCVRCFCCHELCPFKAIYIKRNLIARLFWRD